MILTSDHNVHTLFPSLLTPQDQDDPGTTSLFFDPNNVPPGCPATKHIRWEKISKIAKVTRKPAVFINDINDKTSILFPGAINDNWFLGGVSLMKMYDGLMGNPRDKYDYKEMSRGIYC